MVLIECVVAGKTTVRYLYKRRWLSDKEKGGWDVVCWVEKQAVKRVDLER